MTGSEYPVKFYTDHIALLSLLQGEGISYKGRLSSGLVRMSEYDVDYHYVKGEENVLADGMSRLPIRAMGESKERQGNGRMLRRRQRDRVIEK